MSSQPGAVDPLDSEHLVGKALAVEPPLLVSAAVLILGAALAIKAVMLMRRRPRHTWRNPWKGIGHA